MTANDRQAVQQALLDALIGFILDHGHRDVQPFKEDLQNWGKDWVDVPPAHLPAKEWLVRLAASASPDSERMFRLFEQHCDDLRWEQSYTREDGVVGEDMLRAYGFTEIVGKQGPFLSERVRSGIGVWGPHITYPIHRHRAEEVYIVLAGSAVFTVGDRPVREHGRGEVVHVQSMMPHGFRTREDPLVICYLWRNGDLREISTFDVP
ncbi:MAG: dimethylsulfonioproprionate lyase family protein [Gammaproteobacteria bacterium]|nr:dimethylsulfonioproprionate lyase family protein [Gammaproteobacteria bacterium]